MLEKHRAAITHQIDGARDLRPGSLVERYRRCGKPGCHCAGTGASGHGPSWSLTHAVGGKTVTRIIPPHAVDATRRQIAEYQRFRGLVRALVDTSERVMRGQARGAPGDLARGRQKGGFKTAFDAAIIAEIEALVGPGAVDDWDFEALEQRINADPSDHAGPTRPCACGQPARYAGRHDKTFESVLGPLTLSRAYSHCAACETGFCPRDQALGLPDASLSPGVLRMVGRVGAVVSFAEGHELLAALAGVAVPTTHVEHAAEALGREVAEDERRVVELVTVWSAEGRDEEGTPVRDSRGARGHAARLRTRAAPEVARRWRPVDLESRDRARPRRHPHGRPLPRQAAPLGRRQVHLRSGQRRGPAVGPRAPRRNWTPATSMLSCAP